jgi:hypothetical protein
MEILNKCRIASSVVIGRRDKDHNEKEKQINEFMNAFFNYFEKKDHFKKSARWLTDNPDVKISTLDNVITEYNEICDTNDMAESFQDSFSNAFSIFERNFYTTIFNRYPTKSDNAIAKIIGKDGKTVKAKREKYGQE